MYYVIAHNYKSIFSANDKVVEYLSKGISCSLYKRGDKFVVCFGRYKTKEDAVKASVTLSVKVKIVKE